MKYEDKACKVIEKKIGQFNPKIGLILGSGLGALADQIDVMAKIPYSELEGFFISSVIGHKGEYILGKYKGVDVICMSGRVHLYEGAQFSQVALPLRVMCKLGVKHLIVTNAAGSISPNHKPGDVVMITDHINMQGGNPLVGPNNDFYGPRFVPMEEAYHKKSCEIFKSIAKNKMDFNLPEGVYVGVLGPVYETPAEIRAFRLMGADLVGMSTVPEVIVANHCGMKVSAFSAVTNMASGVTDEPILHDEVLVYAKKASARLIELVGYGIEKLAI